MSTEAQIKANRKNAKKSTGPKTPQGKAAVSQNAIKHGLTATKDVVITENQEDFDLHRDMLMPELNPQTMFEYILATRVVSLAWRLQRAVNVQAQAIDAIQDENSTGSHARESRTYAWKCDPSLNLGRIVYYDFTKYGTFEKLLNYERRIESSLYRTLKQLQTLQKQRTANQNPPNPRLAPGPVPGVTTDQNEYAPLDAPHLAPGSTGGFYAPEAAIQNPQNKPNSAPTNIEHQESSIEHPHDDMQDTTSDILHPTSDTQSVKNKPNLNHSQETAIPLMKRSYDQKAACCNQQKQTQFPLAHLSRGDEVAQFNHLAPTP